MHRDDSDTLLVLALAGESELVLRLSIWDLVDTEPLVGGPQQTWEVSLDILDVVELWSQWVVDVDDDDLPVGLLLVEKSHDTKDLDLLDLTRVSDKFTDLADVQWVIVTLGLGLWVDDVGVLPGLERRSVGRKDDAVTVGSYLRECTVVPEVTLVGEAVADETELALLDVLLDGVEEFLLGDLDAQKCYQASCGVMKSRVSKSRVWAPGGCNGIDLLPTFHWSIVGSQRSCSRRSAARWHTEGCRGREKWGRHPSRCRCGAPKCLGVRSFGPCRERGRPCLQMVMRKSCQKRRSRDVELSGWFAL